MIKMKIRIEKPDFAALSERQLRRIHKAAGEHAVAWFLRDRLPKRFDGSMQERLYWKERDRRWRRRKASRRLENTAHVWTGKTKAAFRRAVLRVTPKFLGVRVTGLGPQYGRFNENWKGSDAGGSRPRKKTSSKPRMREEIARLTDEEVTLIGHRYVGKFVELAREAMKEGKTVTVIS